MPLFVWLCFYFPTGFNVILICCYISRGYEAKTQNCRSQHAFLSEKELQAQIRKRMETRDVIHGHDLDFHIIVLALFSPHLSAKFKIPPHARMGRVYFYILAFSDLFY